MKIDVSDLFDSMYEVAQFARARFHTILTNEDDPYSCEWYRFCEQLSDNLFLPACAFRIYSITHATLGIDEVRKRIICKRTSENGKCIIYYRYQNPYFVMDLPPTPSFVCAPRKYDRAIYNESVFTRPKDGLTVWLGKLPPYEAEAIPPPYNPDASVSVGYFANQSFGFISRGPHTRYYEFHGDWLMREVEQIDASFVRTNIGGEWRSIDNLTEIPMDVFDKAWDAATDAQDTNRE